MARRSFASALAAVALLVGSSSCAAPSTPSPRAEAVLALAGSNHWLVYGRAPTLNDIDGFQSPDVRPTSFQIIARSRSGAEHLVALAHPPQFFWSLNGNLLTAYTDLDTVDWWDLATGRHGTIDHGGHYRYMGAAPGGILVHDDREDPHNKVYFESLAGARRLIGKPFGGLPFYADSAAVDDRGAAIGGKDGQVAYLDFATMKFRALRTGLHHRITCTDVSTTYAACNRGNPGRMPTLVSLDGGPPTTARGFSNFGVIAGNSLLWQPHRKPRVQITRRGGATSATTVRYLQIYPVSAYGKGITSSRDYHSIIAITSDGQASTLRIATSCCLGQPRSGS